MTENLENKPNTSQINPNSVRNANIVARIAVYAGIIIGVVLVGDFIADLINEDANGLRGYGGAVGIAGGIAILASMSRANNPARPETGEAS